MAMSIDDPVGFVGDAFGAMISACWNEGRHLREVDEIVESDSGWILRGSAARYLGGPDTFGPHERWMLAGCSGDVLDVGTGAGRFAADLVGRPRINSVTGVDTSAGAVGVARQRGVDAVVGDFWHLGPRHTSRYDTLTFFGNNLGLFGSAPSVADALRHTRRLVKDGGTLIGSSGSVSVLPASLRQANLDRRGDLGANLLRVRFENVATEWFNFDFYDVQRFADSIPPDLWQLDEAFEGHDSSWAVRLRAVPGRY